VKINDEQYQYSLIN